MMRHGRSAFPPHLPRPHKVPSPFSIVIFPTQVQGTGEASHFISSQLERSKSGLIFRRTCTRKQEGPFPRVNMFKSQSDDSRIPVKEICLSLPGADVSCCRCGLHVLLPWGREGYLIGGKGGIPFIDIIS